MSDRVEVTRIDGGMVNAYLLRSGDRFVLVDTLTVNKRGLIEGALAEAGCTADNLALVVATHGDPDHIGNAAYLHRVLGAPIAAHRVEAHVSETGDMRAARPGVRGRTRLLLSAMGMVFGLPAADRYTPGVLLDDGDSLAEYGIDATVYNLTGHSDGSISVLTADGDLVCGDLMMNNKRPEPTRLVADPGALATSIERVRTLGVRTVYPGHGRPFAMGELA